MISRHGSFSPDWTAVVPGLIEKLASDIADKKKLELRFNLLAILVKELEGRVHKLESAQTKIVSWTLLAEAMEISTEQSENMISICRRMEAPVRLSA